MPTTVGAMRSKTNMGSVSEFGMMSRSDSGSAMAVSGVNRRWLYVMVALMVVVYIVFTSAPSGSVRGRADVTWLPFADPISRFRSDITLFGSDVTRYELLRDIARNMAAGAILTIGFLAATRHRARAVAMTAATVFLAEVIQALTPYARAADINDLIWSSLGAALATAGVTALLSLRTVRIERSTL